MSLYSVLFVHIHTHTRIHTGTHLQFAHGGFPFASILVSNKEGDKFNYSSYLLGINTIADFGNNKIQFRIGQKEQVELSLYKSQSTLPIVSEQANGLAHFLIGRDKGEWRRNMTTYGRIQYNGVYQGVDLTFTFPKKGNYRIKSDFYLDKGEKISQINWELNSKEYDFKICPESEELIIYRLDSGNIVITESKPLFFQNGKELEGKWIINKIKNKKYFGFQIDDQQFDPKISLIIDPGYSTYIGGKNYEDGFGVMIDEDGYVYLSGDSNSVDFPITAGGYDNDSSVYGPYVIKLNPAGDDIIFSTFVQGSDGKSTSFDLFIDSLKQPIITGTSTGSHPTSPGSYKESCTNQDVLRPFVSKISSDGSNLVYSTFVCFKDDKDAHGFKLILDEYDLDSVHLVGKAVSEIDDPIVNCGIVGNYYSGIILKLSGDGETLDAAKCFGGNDGDSEITDLAFNDLTNDYVIAVGSSPDTNINGYTGNNGGIDCFVVVLDYSSYNIIHFTFFGGSDDDECYALESDTLSNILFGGKTKSLDLPITPNAYVSTIPESDIAYGFFAEMNFNLDTVKYCSYYFSTIKTAVNVRTLKYINETGKYSDGTKQFIIGSEGIGVYSDEGSNFLTDGSLSLFLINNTDTQARNINTGAIYSSQPILNDNDELIFVITGYAIGPRLHVTPGAFQQTFGGGSYDVFVQTVFCKAGYSGNLFEECEICNKGTYSTSKMDTCQKCPEGTYNDAVSSTSIESCISCPKGTYNPDQGAKSLATCQKCPAGYYNDQTKSNSISNCKPCQRGFFSETSGLESEDGCIVCPAGTFSDKLAANSYSNCEKCPAGTYNIYTNSTTSDDCIKCPVGTYSQNRGMYIKSGCLKCPAGTYQNIEGANSIHDCFECQEGTYNPNEGSTSKNDCLNCPAGTFSDISGMDSERGCNFCPEGTYSEVVGSRNSADCKKCDYGYYSEFKGSSICKKCEHGTYSDYLGSEKCKLCPPGNYSLFTGSSACEKCPANQFNNEAGSSTCTKCVNDLICLGGNECSEGRDQEKTCSTCLKGYFILQGSCKKCPANADAVYIVILVLIAFIVGGFLFLFRKKLLPLIKNPITGIMITFFQLLSAITALELEWPSQVSGATRSSTSIFTFDIPFVSPECYSEFDYFTRWYIKFSIPFIISFVMISGYFLIKLYYYRKGKEIHDLKMKGISIKFWNYYSSLLKFFYIPYTKLSFEPFDYTKINNFKTLDADTDIEFGGEEWSKHMAAFIISLILFVFGIPIFFFIVLKLAKKNNFNDYWTNRFGWMYHRFKSNRYWYELYEIFFKLILMVAALYSSSNPLLQGWTVFGLILFTILFIVAVKPYKILVPKLYIKQDIKISKFAPEDIIMIGLYVVLFSILSLGLGVFSIGIFVFVYPIGMIIAYSGVKDSAKILLLIRSEEREEREKELKKEGKELKKKKTKFTKFTAFTKFQDILNKKNKNNSHSSNTSDTNDSNDSNEKIDELDNQKKEIEIEMNNVRINEDQDNFNPNILRASSDNSSTSELTSSEK
ncbi:hypothetical protein M0812_00661 [Anaeramoeba flamelloides]|uniref:Tyrosine-protein kinase ephrin type A/B receptor-like domain-containing protein n=1 Tax=Anaeramoeba flamelloides TaxID=1746091 RepID=A0AAV8A605_9EUKA|nr:hypothetical protein M0812_00661 [Anaeramoeba flamelloides]